MSQLALSTIGAELVEEISSTKKEPEWLKELRKNSLSVYKELPIETSPLYNKYTDATRLDPDQVSLSATTDETVPDVVKNRLKDLENNITVIQIGTNISGINVPEELKAKGLVVSSIYDAIQNNPDLIKRALESSNSKEDKFTALNNAAFNTGIFIHIPRNVVIEEPIHVVSCLSLDGSSTISRNVVVADESSKATVVQELYSQKAQKQQAYLELLSTSVSSNSQIDFTTLQMMDQTTINFSTRRSDVAEDAKVNWYLGLFGTLLSRYRVAYYLNGPGATVNDSEVVFGNNEQSFDLQTNMVHEAPNTEGKVIEKSILKNKSKSVFKGMIRIKENAQKAISFLSGRSILLDKDAKSDSIPGLEIFTNDVKATHSASVAQIDEEQIFYLQTRCLSKAEAERTIVEGFLEPLSRKMSYQVRAWIAALIEAKWEEKELKIKTDDELRKFIEVEETRYREDELEQHYKYR